MDLSLIAFAFTAGLISFFSPCAFPMLPGYISYYLGMEKKHGKDIPTKNRVYSIFKDGLIGGMLCAMGAITVFIVFGMCVSFFGDAVRSLVREHIVLMNLVVGIILVIMGIAMLVQLNVKLPIKVKTAPKTKGYLGLFTYGVLYSLVAAGCVAPLFVGVITRAFVASSFFEGVLVFFAYACGLALLLVVVTLLVASAKEAVVKKMNNLLPYVQKAGSLVLIVVGIWLIYCYFLIE
jgi:cytochrome c-type biogenesis protein